MKNKFIIIAIAVFGIFAIATCNDEADLTTVPVITIVTQPDAVTNLTEGSISGSLSVTVSVTENATLSY